MGKSKAQRMGSTPRAATLSSIRTTVSDGGVSKRGERKTATHRIEDAIPTKATGPTPEISHAPLSSKTGEPMLPKTYEQKQTARRCIIVLERANLEIVKRGSEYQLLNADDHAGIIRKYKRNIAECRPDITHQVLLALMDSPLNKRGLLQVYIHTNKNVLIEVNPHTRIPRTFKRFCGLMVQLLHKNVIRASNGPDALLKVIKNPVTQYLPVGAMRIGTSCTAEVVKISDWVVDNVPDDKPFVFVFGSMAHGNIDDLDYVDKYLSFSSHALSAACAVSKLMNALEDKFEIL